MIPANGGNESRHALAKCRIFGWRYEPQASLVAQRVNRFICAARRAG